MFNLVVSISLKNKIELTLKMLEALWDKIGETLRTGCLRGASLTVHLNLQPVCRVGARGQGEG